MNLPVEELREDFERALEAHPAVLLTAPPGSGKTTRVPIWLMERVQGRVLVLEPRRLAARWAARFVAAGLGQAAGESIGYQVRFEDVTGPATRVTYLTEGVLNRRLLDDPELRGVEAVVLDEFHERHLQAEVGLALLRRLQQRRPELKLVVMSATLRAEELALALGGCPVLRSQGRLFAVEVVYDNPGGPLEQQVQRALQRAAREHPHGHLLVFLPGAAEIRRCRELAEQLPGFEVFALHGDLPAEEQDAALRPSERRKILLSTNVAESSVTVEGVIAVIDSGLARVAWQPPGSGRPVLRLEGIPRSSADQRAGRAGRTGPGRCYRLYSEREYAGRAAEPEPEILRLDLSQTVLELAAMGVTRPQQLPWLTPPPAAALESARDLLSWLGALDQAGGLTPVGREMARYPLPVRPARLLAACPSLRTCRLAALLAEVGPEPAAGVALVGRSDPLHRLDLLRSRGSDSGALQAVERAARQLERLLPPADRWPALERTSGAQSGAPSSDAARESLNAAPRSSDARRASNAAPGSGDARRDRPSTPSDETLQRALLAAYPDRVGRLRRRGGELEVLLAAGGAAPLHEASIVRQGDLVVAVEVQERQDGAGRRLLARQLSQIESDWLLEDFMDRIEDRCELVFTQDRVEEVRQLRYLQLVLEETRRAAPPSPEASRLLFEAARRRGLTSFAGRLDSLLARTATLARALPEEGFKEPDEARLERAFEGLCQGLTRFDELGQAASRGAWLGELGLSPGVLDRLAPTTVDLPGRRRVPIHYEPDRPPWLASRLQDFCGLMRGPEVARGRVPVVLHLLAPNQRPVQVTTDLSGFWERHYPALRRELCRKYPRHPWPEDPRLPLPAREPRPRR